MKRNFILEVVMLFLLCNCAVPSSLFARSHQGLDYGVEHLQEIQGEILRLYEDRSDEWGSYILLRDLYGDERKIYVHPTLTLVRHNGQTLEMQQITGGMKAKIIYQKPYHREARAVSIIVSGIFYG